MEVSKLKIDTKSIADGRWVTIGGAFGDLAILTRGYTDEFYDTQTAKLSLAAQAFGGVVADIPNGVRRRINAELLQECLVLDVKNLTIDGQPVAVADFHTMLFQQDYVRLANACWTAAARVSSLTKEQLESAEGNSGGASGSISSPQATANA